jgi:riboflavin synthase
MFTGLVETLGLVQGVRVEGPGRRLTLSAPSIREGVKLCDSIAVNGCCLTVVELTADGFAFEAGPETLRLTNLGNLDVGQRANLERSLRLGDSLGGHLVTGHIDGLGHIRERRREGDWEFLWFSCPSSLAEQMVPKGSVTVDGISLTLVEVTADAFSVALIPHTLAVTTLGFKEVGDAVNLETDLLAKYVWKCLQSQRR